MRTVLKYPGSKWNIASKLVELIPEHHSYVEPFFGSGAVLFNKPADKAVNEIIRRLDIPENMYTETWESKGKWQGTVRKYVPEVIDMVRSWYVDHGYPRDIEYMQTDGQMKSYHVIWRKGVVTA